MNAAVLNQLLRSPATIAKNCRTDQDLKTITLTSLAAIVAGGMAFGGVVGSFRGGIQILYGAIKIPLAMIVTLAICAPAFHALAAVLGRAWPMRSIISLVLAAAARSSLVLLAFTPALWLGMDWGLGYHKSAMAASMAYALAGLAALSVLLRGIGKGQGQWLTTIAFIGMFFAVGGQSAWILRPYLLRPKAESVPFVRAREGGFADALLTASRSAADIYDEERMIETDIYPDARKPNPRIREVE